MAIFHFNAHVVSRGKGQSAIAKAAYNSRTKLEDERTGTKRDYSRMDGIMFSGVFAPKDAPEWASDRGKLWNAVERREDESNRAASARLAREIRVALPHELTDQQREWLVKDFVREQFTRKGMVADVNIHAPGGVGDERNYHAHILVTLRTLTPEGFGLVNREWNSKGQLEQWREKWEQMANKHLERHGHEERIDRRTLEAQGIDREATTHRGPHVDAIERRGVEADNTRQNVDRRAELAELRAAFSNITRDIAAERNELAAAPDRQPAPANQNELQSVGELAKDAAEATPGALAGAVTGVASGITDALKIIGSIGSLLGQDKPAPPPTKEIAEAQKQERLAHAERMLHDREYRRRYQCEQEQQKQNLAADRTREADDERGRSRQR